MGVRMGISATIPKDNEFVDCCMFYDSEFMYNLEHIQTSCIKCQHYSKINEVDDEGYDECYGCYRCLDGYYILPKRVLLDNTKVDGYDDMLRMFEENDIDEIYLILK